MKRFLVFAGDDYYPIGGWRDLVGSADTISQAKALAPAHVTLADGSRDWAATGGFDWAHVVDTRLEHVRLFGENARPIGRWKVVAVTRYPRDAPGRPWVQPEHP